MGFGIEAVQAVSWLVSIINFVIMYALFRLVVILPMQEAGRLRRQRVTLRFKEIEDVASEAKAKLAEFEQKFSDVEVVLAEITSSSERTAARSKAKLEEKAVAQESYILDRAKIEVHSIKHEVEHEIRSRIASGAVARAEELLAKVLDAGTQNAILAADIKKVGGLSAS